MGEGSSQGRGPGLRAWPGPGGALSSWVWPSGALSRGGVARGPSP